MSIKLFIYQYRIFWRIKTLKAKVRSWFLFRYHGMAFKTQDKKYDYYTLTKDISSPTILPILIALITSIIIIIIDTTIFKYINIKIPVPEDESYFTLFAAISGMCGIFIGLYYAAVSTVSTSIYNKTPSNIRDLIATDRTGNAYIKFVAYVAYLALIFFSLYILGIHKVITAVAVLTILSGVCIYAFIQLGRRVFDLFDPTVLSREIFRQLKDCIDSIKADSYELKIQGYEENANRRAYYLIDTLDSMSSICEKEKHLQGRPYLVLSLNIIKFLCSYEMIKKEIPPSSNWYTQKYKHRRWFRTDESEIQLAYSTGSTIKPEIVHDYLWIESKLILLIEKCINNKLQEKRFSEVAQLVNHIGKYLRIVSYEGDVSSAVNILDNISYRIINYMTVNNVSSYEYEYLALIDLFASMPINIFLAYLSKVDSFDTNKMRKTINCIKWTNDYDIYRHNISKYQHDKLDWIRKRIESEIMTDNKIISPVWYITELLLNKEADKLFINTNDLITGNINLFNKWHQSLIVLNNPWYTSQLIDREWEYTNKVKIHLDTFISKMENIARQRNIEELKWPEYKKEDYERIIDEFNSQVISGMAEHIVPLVINKRSEEYPDTSGEYLHVTCEYIFNIILNNDVKLLDKCFKSYLFGCLLLFDEMRPKGSLEDWNAQQQMKIASAILVDVMCLSGYAKLMSEYYENESMWNIILKYWDIYLGQNDGIARYKGLIAIIALKQTSYEIPYRSVLRTSWMLQIKEKLRKLPRKNISNRMFMENLDDIAHNSSLIKLLTPGPFGLLYDGIDIFLGYYLRSHRFKKEASFDWIKRDLMKDINSIENRNQDI